MLSSIMIRSVRLLPKKGLLLILKSLTFFIQSICNMTTYVCKVCKLSSDKITDFILCRGKCKQYLHYLCAKISEERFRNMLNKRKRKWKCEDCKAQKRLNIPITEDLDSEADSGNSLSSDNGSVEDCTDNQNVGLPNSEIELNSLRQELTETVVSLEQLRTEYNEIALKVADFERQMKAQVTNLHKVSEGVRDTNKTVYTIGQNSRDNRLEIHGLFLGVLLTDDVKRKIVEVGKCFGVEFSVQDIDKVDVLNKKNLRRHILVVHFASKEVRDKLIAARKKRVINANLPGCSDETRIYINENLCSYFKTLWYEARKVAKEKGYQFVWVREGKLFVKKDPNFKKKRITCKEDLDELV